MQNNTTFKFFLKTTLLSLSFVFLAYASSAQAETPAVHTGSLRICSVLADTTHVLASADATVPSGTFSLSLATTKDFTSPLVTHTFNAQAFAHNTTIDGVAMHCTDKLSVPFGQYYYNSVSMSGATWSPSRYFDSASSFSVAAASLYTNGLFTADDSDDVLINTAADGLVVVDAVNPNRTVIVLNTFTPVLDDLRKDVDFCSAVDNVMTYEEFVSARNIGAVSYSIDVSTSTHKATATIVNTTGCEIPMSFSAYKMVDGFHLSTQEYYSGTPEIQATSTTILTIPIPACLTQTDLWFGTAPRTLVDNYNYGDLPLPVVVGWKLAYIIGVDAFGGVLGPYCAPHHDTNTPPTITLIGANPATLTVGQTWNEPGATAADLEDGDITSKIVITGTVGIIPGTYTLTYSVKDTEGLSASTTRTVIVLPVAACNVNVNMISNGGFENPKLSIPWGSVALGTHDFFWTSFDTVVYPFVEVQAGYTEGSVQWLPHTGTQYAEIDGGTNHDVSQVLATIPGNTYTLSYWASPRPNLSTTTNIMNISVNGQLIDTYIAEGSVMTDWSKRSYDFIATTTQTRVSFTQGQNVHPGEGVFLDDVSVVCNPSVPAINHAPIITLVGANPITLTTGGTFTDPGATATDLEDGNITSKIVITGTVDVNTPGTYTLTYTVTDSGGLSASTTRQVIVASPVVPTRACVMVSDETTYVGHIPAVATYNQNPAWTASIPGATWIWSTYKVVDTATTTTTVFTKTFYATSTPTGAALSIAADNSYVVKINGVIVGSSSDENNFNSSTQDVYSVASAITAGVNTMTIEVVNWPLHGVTPETNPAGLLYKLELSGNGCGPVVTNTPPVITLIGANPATLTVGQTWNEPGATAADLEDGNITSKIVITGTVDVNTPGTYTLTYTVTDSGGLSASTTRQVIVAGNPVSTGSITFCSIFANKDNMIATTSANLPFGTFTMKLGTTTDIANSTVYSKVWNASSFAPNKKIILSQNDADCVTYNNLPLGSYYYSELGITGSQWIVSSTSPKYNDQLTAPVNNIFDLFAYSPELFTATTTDDASRNVNSDGLIVVSSDRRDHTVVLATKYADPLACMLPEFTSASSATGEVGKSFSYTLSATSTSASVITYSASSLPAGLSLSGDTISGTPTVSGAFTVTISASNSCGLTSKNITITIAPAQDVCTTCGGGSGGGGGGGGGNGPVVSSLTITNEKVVEITPGVALVTWNTNLPATKEVGYGNTSQPASFITAPFGYATSTVRVSSPLETVHSYTIPIQSGKTYYFRPVSSDSKTTIAGIELVLNPGTQSTGGTTAPNACYYLFDYLKQGWDNNPVEVKKLQVFLRDLEGFAVNVTGVYDDQTVSALNTFQNRYKDDILTPWGHAAPTSFTYITTKKKVNEIYCKTAFPVTVQQQAEIDAYKAFLFGLLEAGVTLGLPTEDQLNQPVIIDTNEVGVLPGLSTSTLGTLANGEMNATSTTAGRLTANVIASSKKLGNLAAAIFAWPWDWARGWFGGNDDNQCTNQSVFSSWFSWILIIIILTMSYLWYRERRENKKAEDINKELDLM